MRTAPHSAQPLLAALVLAALAAPAWAQEYTVFTTPGDPVEPEGVTATVIDTGEDDASATVSLPFDFPYFGRLFDELTISSNGWAALVPTDETVSVNPALPGTAEPNGVLAPLWDDLATGDGTVRTFVNGTAPQRTFVVDWVGVRSFDGQTSGIRFQVALSETTGVVQFAFGSGGTFSGLSYTSGIEDPTGTIAFSANGTGNGQASQPTGRVIFQPSLALVGGRVERERPVASESGLGGTVETGIAVRGATVRVVREDTEELAGAVRTQADGSFNVQIPGLAEGVTLAFEVVTEGAAGRVVGAAGDPYSYRFATGVSPDPFADLGTVTLDAAVDVIDSAFRRALNVQQAVERGRRAALDAAEFGAANIGTDPVDTVAALDVTWVPGVVPTGGTRYVPGDGTTAPSMTVAEGASNPDAYDDDVILRAYGAHVLASLSEYPVAIMGSAGFAEASTDAQAWAVGFPYFFAAGLAERARLVDTTSSTAATVTDLESPPAAARGSNFPAAVAGSLWDLVDPANESEDEYEGTVGPAASGFVDVLAHVDRLLDATADEGDGTEFTVRSFFDVWRATGTPEDDAARARTARVFIHHGTLPDDDAEPNDRIDEATPTDGAGTVVSGRTLSPANADVFTVVVPGPLAQSLTFVVAQPESDVDLVVDVLDAGGGVIDSATNVGVTGSGRATLRIEPTLPFDPGTYHVRVRSADAATGTYALSVYLPFLLATGDLPEWTVGVPFKLDLAAAGGVPPYAFDTTASIPGVRVAESDSRLAGTPTEAGTFDVDISVTDGAEPANSAGGTRPFKVNPAPTLPPLLGIAEGRTGSRIIGSGGTGTFWTPLVQPDNGMTLVGGDTLRLEGDSGAPTTFLVSADAVDTVGAELDAAGAFVVVTADLFAADGTAVPSGDAFGWFVDALADSDIDVTLHFRGTGETPVVTDVLDDKGRSIRGDARVSSFGRKVKIRNVRPAQTGRVHVIFTGEGFAGTVGVRAKVSPRRKLLGEEGITFAADVVEAAVDVLAGARVKIDLRRSPSPTSLRPTVDEIEAPDGSLLALPTERRRGPKRAILRFTADQDGRYLLRFAGADGTTGPLFYKVTVRTPRRARLVLD